MDSFGARLRYERERRQIALTSIAEGTKIGVGLLEALERDDVSRWPSGIFRKSFIRSYAEAIGLDADSVVREFVERYPDPLEVDNFPPATRSSSSSSSAAGTPTPRAARDSGPLSVKLTITWSGSVHSTIGRLADWRFGRLPNWKLGRLGDWKIGRGTNPHECAGGVADPVPPDAAPRV
jgi:transcriptional regulator with XRE-family HTH domain